MDNIDKKVRAFFQAYEDRFMRALHGDNAIEGPVDDVEGTVNAFAEHFIEASPAGVQVGNNDETFRKMIPKGNDFYRSIGTKRMKIRDIIVSPLNEHHVMATVHWDSCYQKKNGTEISIAFPVIYLLQHLNGDLKIFAYITGDEQGALRDAGVV
ncbi:MAG TPA: hypothetical protein VIM75_24340 [Ohtaekwangia sp.]|uniref:hypothetical protein n=1 Tax=Ohtaekwangia sp. TaxID=2066019 RepID=UPI002F91EABC